MLTINNPKFSAHMNKLGFKISTTPLDGIQIQFPTVLLTEEMRLASLALVRICLYLNMSGSAVIADMQDGILTVQPITKESVDFEDVLKNAISKMPGKFHGQFVEALGLTQSKVLAHLERHGWSYSDSSTMLLDRTRPFSMSDKNFDIVQVLQFLTMEERDGRWGVAYDRTTGFFVFNFRETALSDVDSEVEKRIGSQHVHNHQTFREVLGLTEPQEEIAPTRPPVERLMIEDEFCKLSPQAGAGYLEMLRVDTSDVTPSTSMDINVMLQLANQYALTLDAIDAIPDGQPDKEKYVQTLVGLLENMEKAVPAGVPDCSKEVIRFIQKVGSYIKFSNTVKVEHRLGRIVSVAYALGMPFVKVEFIRTVIEQYRGEPVQVKYVPIWNNFNGATETVEIL